MSEPLVWLQAVRRIFEGGLVVALDGVDLAVQRGEFVAITGPSGSGKSTLLNLIGAMDLPDQGSVHVDGIHVTDRKSMERVRAAKIGYVFQMHNLIPVLSAADNVEIPLIPQKVGRRQRRRKAEELLTSVGLGDRCDSNVRVLSGGERQRVAIARALAHDPPLLLADEPTGNLDSHTGHEVMDLIHHLRKQTNAALILVTHNEELCVGADRHLRMQDGKLSCRVRSPERIGERWKGLVADPGSPRCSVCCWRVSATCTPGACAGRASSSSRSRSRWSPGCCCSRSGRLRRGTSSR